tara:strand:- start:348 stop:710 length:363 start_codon:yes stop_codon:yes gene_type:complete
MLLVAVLTFLVLILWSFLWVKSKEIKALQEIHEELLFSHRSKVVKHGQSFEQLFPFMSNYPYNHNNFRFIGSPIDGISFEDDSIVFIEFKTGNSKLTKKQQSIRDLINSKKIKWKEIRDR